MLIKCLIAIQKPDNSESLVYSVIWLITLM
jgi:hypothetical protein